MNANKKFGLFMGAMFLAFYGFVAFAMPTLTSRRSAEIEHGKYTLRVSKKDLSLIPFAGDDVSFHLNKKLEGEDIRGSQWLILDKIGFSRTYSDHDLDGKVDHISYEENGIKINMNRENASELYSEEFEQGDDYLRQTRERFKDFISEVEEEAGFSK